MDINEFRRKRAERQSTYVKFREGDEVKYIRFLDERPANQARLKAFDSEAKKYLYDADIPDDNTTLKISIVLRLNVVTYEAGVKILFWASGNSQNSYTTSLLRHMWKTLK